MIDIEILPDESKPAKNPNIIKVIGVGGAGGNAVNNMFKKGIHGVDYFLVNTDSQDFEKSPIPDENKIQIGKTLTSGLGAGNNPEQGEEAAKESIDDLRRIFDENTHMVFITAGMGGGTGTGAAPIVAKIAKEKEVLTVAVVTIPAPIEGKKRVENAKQGLDQLKKYVDSIIVIDNNKINKIYHDLEVTKAWEKADDILAIAVKGIAEIITVKGHVNVDFADVRSVLKNSGVALMSIGEAEGELREAYALREALKSPLLNNNDIKGAKNVLINISASEENMVKTVELERILSVIQALTKDTDIIHGLSINNELGKKIRITIIITGFDEKELNFNDRRPEVIKDILDIVTDGEPVEPTGVKVVDKPFVSEDGSFSTGTDIGKTKEQIKKETEEHKKELSNGDNHVDDADYIIENIIYRDGEVGKNSYFDKNLD